MKQVAIVALALGIAASSAWASDDTSTLLQLNAQLQDRTKAYDVAGVGKLVTNDYTLVNGSGAVWDRQAFLRDVGESKCGVGDKSARRRSGSIVQ